MKNQKITPETSFKTLKAMLPDASTVHTPKGQTLIKSDAEVLITVKEDSGVVIVYKNGFFAYIDDRKKVTARSVANCHVMKFPKAEGGFNNVEEAVFENMPFPTVLSQFGMMNIEHQNQVQVSRNENLSLDAEILPDDPRLTAPDFSDELDLDGEGDIWEKRLAMLPQAMDKLTARQREIVEMFFFRKQSQEQIADSLHINQSTVSRTLRSSFNKMEKYYKK